MQTGRAESFTPLGADLLDRLVEFFGSLGHAVLALAMNPENGQPIYICTQHGQPHRATEEWLVANKMNALRQRELDPLLRERIIRASIVVDVPEAAGIERALTAQFGEQIYSCSIYSGAYDCQVIEAFAPGINKWTGVESMAGLLHLDPERIVTIGDDVNDIQMLQNARLSFAMGSASPQIQRTAKAVTGAQADGGVGQAIEKVLDML